MIRKKVRIKDNQGEEEYRNAFRNEHWCLILLNRLQHPNLVPLLASYTYCNEHNLLFPAYDMDLRDFLQMDSPHGQFKWTVTFYSALHGLASALCSTHRLHLEEQKHGVDFDGIGYHHDLRPANILVSSETFILADFGLAKFKPADPEIASQTRWKLGAGDYLAPECMNEDFLPQNVGRAIDVWAFGCLVMEVITYMEKGVSGLEQFRKLRISQGRREQWYDSYFFTGDGIIKPDVQKWLTGLFKSALFASPIAMLAKLSGKALKEDPKDRPTMAHLCMELAYISLKSHFLAIRAMFQEHLDFFTSSEDRALPGMKLWFVQERFVTFGHMLGLHGDQATPALCREFTYSQDHLHNDMKSLYLRFKREEHQAKVDVNTDPRSAANCSPYTSTSFEDDVSALVGSLWSYLPVEEQRKGESAWLRAMLNGGESGYLGDIHRTFKFEDDPVYEKRAAMAMMKKIRLEMEATSKDFPQDFVLSAKDFQSVKLIRGHTIGLFKTDVLVLVEWMYYSAAWEAIPPHERTIVMSMKAQGFGSKIKSPGIRTLDCLGTFESVGQKKGYGFVYRIPAAEPGTKSISSITTLLQLLEHEHTDRAKAQYSPNLSERFRLASMLAGFLEDFHCIGWLHEDFNSNNVLFSSRVEDNENDKNLSQTLERPYIIGLNRSRPDGQAWHTQGSWNGENLQNYQHPEYGSTGRYRLEYDYYSLGLVLLEIGFWRPLSY